MGDTTEKQTALLSGEEKGFQNGGRGQHIVDTEDPDTQCGVGSCKPRGLQVFANIATFTGCLSMASLLSNTLLTYVNSQVTTLERQFGFTSSETGIIMASNDIGYIILTFFIGHFARRAHIPRVLSVSIMLFGISGLICCLPHFLFGTNQGPGIMEEEELTNVTSGSRDMLAQLCLLSNESVVDHCKEPEDDGQTAQVYRRPREHASAALTIIVIGMVLQGFAKSPRSPFIITYIDDNVAKVKTGFYMGVIISLAIFGPAFAFGLGSYFTRIYVTLQETDLYPRHPRWIGAWWLGYLVFGATAIVVSLPLFFFPRRMRNRPSDSKEQKKKPEAVKEKKQPKSIQKQIYFEAKDFLHTLSAILSNPCYICLTLASVTHLFAIGGAHAFMPKYLESQFGIPAWKANLLMAGLSIPAASLGTFVGGWLTRKYKLSPINNFKFINIGMAVTIALVSLGFFLGCPQPPILRQPGSVEMVSDLNNCSSTTCHCNDEAFFPICGSDGGNYFSPCHAGCLDQEGTSYYNCTCIPNGGQATAGLCDPDCPMLYPYAISKAVSAFMSTLLIMPKVLVKIRCVPEKQKPVAVAFATCMTSLFGWLLGPIIYGRVIDSSCLIWDSSCGQRGACALYDTADFRMKMHGFFVAGRASSLIVLIVGMVIAMKTKLFDKLTHEADKEEETKPTVANGGED